ncbi:MAG: biotin/lipoyl-binding protein [Vicinamibacterales bacterium]
MNRKTILIGLLVLVLAGIAAGAGFYYRTPPGPTVTVETIRTRDLEAIVSASGKIQPKRLVNISADTSGRVVNLAVNEGDRVARGQFLLQIDPKSLRTRVDSGTASLQAAESSLDQQRQAVETARVQLEQARRNLARQQELWSQQLTTRESLDKAESDVKGAESTLREREKQVGAQAARIGQEKASLESARYDSEQGPHRIAHRRHRHAPKHPGGGDGRHRNDEQRRHGAPDTRRHVGHPGRGRSRRNEHPERPDRTAREDHDRRTAGSNLQGARERDRQQPHPEHLLHLHEHTGNELQSRRHAR